MSRLVMMLMFLLVCTGGDVLYAQQEPDEPQKEVRDSTHFYLYFESKVLRVESPYEAEIDLYDILGRKRGSYRATEGESRHYLGNFPAGCYVVTVTGRGKRASVRVILD